MTTAAAIKINLPTINQRADAERGRRRVRGQPAGEKDVHEQRHQHQLLDGRAPFHQRKVAAGVFEQHRLVNHRQFQMRRRIVHGNAPGFREQHNEQRGERHHVRRVEHFPGRALRGLDDVADVGRTGGDGDGENGQHHRRFGDGGNGHFAAAAHAAKRAARIKSAQREKKSARARAGRPAPARRRTNSTAPARSPSAPANPPPAR